MTVATTTTVETNAATSPAVCTTAGCSGEVFARGLCSKHYQAVRRTGSVKTLVVGKAARLAVTKTAPASSAKPRVTLARTGQKAPAARPLPPPPPSGKRLESPALVASATAEQLLIKPAIFEKIETREWERMHALCTFFGKDVREIAAELLTKWMADIDAKLAEAKVSI